MKGDWKFLTLYASIPLAILVLVVLLGYLIRGLEYFPAWYRPTATGMVVWFGFRALFYARVSQLLWVFALVVICPMIVGVVGQFVEDSADSIAQTLAIIIVLAPFVTAGINFFIRRKLRGSRHEYF